MLKEDKHEYLGDGLYAVVENDMVKVYTERENGEHYLYFEHETFAALVKFVREVWH